LVPSARRFVPMTVRILGARIIAHIHMRHFIHQVVTRLNDWIKNFLCFWHICSYEKREFGVLDSRIDSRDVYRVLYNIYIYFNVPLDQRFLNCRSRFQMGSQSEMLGSRKFNSDTLHQDLICFAAKNKHICLIKTWFSFINFCTLETNSNTISFHMYIVYQRNKLFMRKYLFYI